MTAAQWQEVLCRVRSLSAADKDRLLTYLHALHDKPQQLTMQHSSPREPNPCRTRPRYCKAPAGLAAGFTSPIFTQSAEKISGTLIEL